MNKSYWMKPYIMQKSNVKKSAKDEFKKDFLSLSTAEFLERPWEK